MAGWSEDEEKGFVAEFEDPVDGIVENALMIIDEIFAYEKTVTRSIYITYVQVIQILETDFYFNAFMLLQENIIDEAYAAHEIVLLLIKQWKGQTVSGLHLIFKEKFKFTYEFKQLQDDYFNITLDLLQVLGGYSDEGAKMIKLWRNRNYGNWPKEMSLSEKKTRRMEIVHSFEHVSIPDLSAFGHFRKNPLTEVTDDQKKKFLAIIKGKAGETDFWDFHNPEVPKKHQVHTNSSMAKKRSTPTEQYGQLVSRIILNYPAVKFCPNCLQNHKLEKCPNIKTNPSENPAAYTNTDFGAKSKLKHPQWLLRCTKRLTKLATKAGEK